MVYDYITDELLPFKLKEHLSRYYKNQKISSISIGRNILDEPVFRTVTFTSGRFITFCQDMVGGWFRHRGGNRYGCRSEYEGMVEPH